MWGLKNGLRILHTAHRTSTTHVAWERLFNLLTKANIEISSSYRAFGKEHIEVDGDGVIEFRTRTSKGGLGEGYDILIIDEAQEYQDDQQSALKYVVSDSKNPMTLMCGTPPTPVSSGTVFTKFREETLKGKGVNSAWAEWSVDEQQDPNDKKYWYQANPSLGTILTERKIQDEISGDDIDFNIQRLGYWTKYSLKSEISKADWQKLIIKGKLHPKGKLFVGIKYGQDGTNMAMSIAVKQETGNIFVESIDCRSIRKGNTWIIDFLKKADVQNITIDGSVGQSLLVDELKKNKIKTKVILPTVKEIIIANSTFEQAVYGDKVCHNDQPSLTAVVTNCEKRAIGTSGGFGYKSLKPENDIVLMDSVILAYWQCSVFRECRKQKISY
nr:MAG TPA: Large Terminase [Bacteriophage sp.]